VPIAPGITILNKYHILNLINEGGSGRVWLATETTFGDRQVAIKEPRTDLPASDQEDLQRFYQQELKISALLEESGAPNLVRTFTVEPYEGKLLLVMAYMAGGDLARLLRQSGPLPVAQAVTIAQAVLAPLQIAHEHPQGIVHRDIKPQNILFDNGGKAHLADWGLAQLSGVSGRSLLSARAHPGSPLYMAPEQSHTNDYLTPAADVYALGCVFFEVLTGRPYKRVRPGTLVSSLRADIPRWLDAVIAKSLAQDPYDRYEDARGLLTALTGSQPDFPATINATRQENVLAGNGHNRWLVVGLVSLVVAAGLIYMAWALLGGRQLTSRATPVVTAPNAAIVQVPITETPTNTPVSPEATVTSTISNDPTPRVQLQADQMAQQGQQLPAVVPTVVDKDGTPLLELTTTQTLAVVRAMTGADLNPLALTNTLPMTDPMLTTELPTFTGAILTELITATNPVTAATATETERLDPTNTWLPTVTSTPGPIQTYTPPPSTVTNTSQPPTATETSTPQPTPTVTNTWLPTATSTPDPIETYTPLPPTATNTFQSPTATATATLQPSSTATLKPTATTMRRPTNTVTKTPLPTATNTQPVPTSTPPATTIPTRQSPTSTPLADSIFIITRNNINIRSGPGTLYSVLGTAQADQQFKILGSTPDGTWLQIVFDDSTGWVWKELGNIAGATGIAVITDIPTPTAYFEETFTSLDQWQVYNNGGQIEFLTAGISLKQGIATQYPFLITKGNPFPTDGRFRLEVTFRYSQVELYGTGISITTCCHTNGINLSEATLAQNRLLTLLNLWQDAKGMRVGEGNYSAGRNHYFLGANGDGTYVTSNQLQSAIITYSEQNVVSVWVNGVAITNFTSIKRPDRITLGNHFVVPPGAWSTLEILSIRVFRQ
jgi:serine/threonine protein kinase